MLIVWGSFKHKSMKVKIQGHLTTLYMVLFQSSFVILCPTYVYKNLAVIGPQ